MYEHVTCLNYNHYKQESHAHSTLSTFLAAKFRKWSLVRVESGRERKPECRQNIERAEGVFVGRDFPDLCRF